MKQSKLIGPFRQLLPMTGLPLKGALSDSALPVMKEVGIWTENGVIQRIDTFKILLDEAEKQQIAITRLQGDHVCLPGFIDAHTHICFAGSRANDYAMRNAGSSYLDIAKAGGGIWDTVTQTRKASEGDLIKKTIKRAKQHLKNGVTTIEVKSGYGLSMSEELKLLRAIKMANHQLPIDLIPTCLAAHMLPKDFAGSAVDYLHEISSLLFPIILEEKLTKRIDAFIEESAFSASDMELYFKKAKALGFELTIHADQFTTGGSAVAVAHGAVSADHLEASTSKEIALLAKSDVIATALPGASLGLGCGYTPARRLLDAGCALAIASDHNPGSAPMGDLLTQAAILGTFEKLTNTEVLAGITFRAAAALNLKDRGKLGTGFLADFSLFHTKDYREILYNQGSFKPCMVFKNGECVYDRHKSS